jgi:hypothetical protein
VAAVIVVFVVVGLAAVFVVAAVTVGREAWRLGHQPRSTIFDLDEAVAYVADDLPAETQARLTYDEVRLLVGAQLDHLRAKGVIGLPGEDPGLVRGRGNGPTAVESDDDAEDAGADVEDVDAHAAVDADIEDKDVVVGDDDAVAVVLGAVDAEGLDVGDEDVFLVVRSLHRYLDDIGAVGPSAT